MSEDCSPGGWTLDTLEKHLSGRINDLKETAAQSDERNKERFAAAKESVMLALGAADKALIKAEAASDVRYAHLNELRGALSDQTNIFMPRAEYAAQHQAMIERVDSLGNRIGTIEAMGLGKKEGFSSINTVVVGVALLVSMLASVGSLIIALAWHTR